MKSLQMSLLLLMSMPLSGIGQSKEMALAELKSLLYSEKEWIKVHAAEFLLWEGYYVDEVRAEFLKEEQQFGHTPKYRIGIWRVLAQAAVDKKDRQQWVDRIIAAYNDVKGEDRLHAIETLAKLQVPVMRYLPQDLEGTFLLYAQWNHATKSKRSRQKVKDILVQRLLDDELTELETHVTSYVLRYLGPLSKKEYSRIRTWMGGKDLNVALQSNLLATLVISCPKSLTSEARQNLKEELIALRDKKEPVPHIMMALAQKQEAMDQKIVSDLYGAMRDTKKTDYNSDLHATAAYMVLKTTEREK